MRAASEIEEEAKATEERAAKLRRLAEAQREIERLQCELGLQSKKAAARRRRPWTSTSPRVLGAMVERHAYTVDVLALATGLSKRQVRSALDALSKKGVVSCIRRGRGVAHPDGARSGLWALASAQAHAAE